MYSRRPFGCCLVLAKNRPRQRVLSKVRVLVRGSPRRKYRKFVGPRFLRLLIINSPRTNPNHLSLKPGCQSLDACIRKRQLPHAAIRPGRVTCPRIRSTRALARGAPLLRSQRGPYFGSVPAHATPPAAVRDMRTEEEENTRNGEYTGTFTVCTSILLPTYIYIDIVGGGCSLFTYVCYIICLIEAVCEEAHLL